MSGLSAAWRISVVVPREAAEAFADVLESLGGAVTWLVFDEAARDIRLDAYVADEPDPATLRESLTEAADRYAHPVPKAAIAWLPARDWLAENRRHFPPFEVGGFTIYGEDPIEIPPGRIGLRVAAGLAFGSGRHESTAGCLIALDGLRRRTFRSPLDMGCGSGILAMAIAKIWRVPVLAADCDPAAVRVARANARHNRVASLVRTIHGDGFASPWVARRAPFDLIVANILAEPLRRMARDLVGVLQPGGVVVLSGVLIEEANAVAAAYRRLGLPVVRRIDLNGWRTLVLGV